MPLDWGVVFGCPISKQLWSRDTDAWWVQTHGGAANSNTLLWFPEHLGKKARDGYHGETEAQHQLMNCSRSFQRQTITTTIPAPAQPPPTPKLLLLEQNCISAAADGARFTAGPRHPPPPVLFPRLGSSLCCRTHKMALCDSSTGTLPPVSSGEIWGAGPTRESGDELAPLAGRGHGGTELQTLSVQPAQPKYLCSAGAKQF